MIRVVLLFLLTSARQDFFFRFLEDSSNSAVPSAEPSRGRIFFTVKKCGSEFTFFFLALSLSLCHQVG